MRFQCFVQWQGTFLIKLEKGQLWVLLLNNPMPIRWSLGFFCCWDIFFVFLTEKRFGSTQSHFPFLPAIYFNSRGRRVIVMESTGFVSNCLDRPPCREALSTLASDNIDQFSLPFPLPRSVVSGSWVTPAGQVPLLGESLITVDLFDHTGSMKSLEYSWSVCYDSHWRKCACLTDLERRSRAVSDSFSSLTVMWRFTCNLVACQALLPSVNWVSVTDLAPVMFLPFIGVLSPM